MTHLPIAVERSVVAAVVTTPMIVAVPGWLLQKRRLQLERWPGSDRFAVRKKGQ